MSLKPITYVAVGLGTAFAIPAAVIVEACRAVTGNWWGTGEGAPKDARKNAARNAAGDTPEDATKFLTVVALPTVRGRPKKLTLTVSDSRAGGRPYKISVPCGPVRPLEAQRRRRSYR